MVGYDYTKPRAPIAAMYSSPGPMYGLPGLVGQRTHDPRSVHQKMPAYSFGVRHGKFADDSSPGPCYLPGSRIYKDGKDGTPSYSLYSRQKDGTIHNTPGPGAYSVEASGPSSHFRAAAYSFGSRHKHRTTDTTPAANSYSLPGMLGKTVQSGKPQAPIPSMTGRSKIGGFHEDMQKTPGPGNYSVTDPNRYKYAPASYSMSGRNMLPGDSTQKPGPGAHSPERVYMNKRAAPNFSFGIRHSPYIAPLIVECPE